MKDDLPMLSFNRQRSAPTPQRTTTDLTPTQRKIAAQILRLAAESYDNHGCNDFELPNTPENFQFVKDMIAASDYMDDGPEVVSDQLVMMDTDVMRYCADLLDPTPPAD